MSTRGAFEIVIYERHIEIDIQTLSKVNIKEIHNILDSEDVKYDEDEKVIIIYEKYGDLYTVLYLLASKFNYLVV